jgi:hypothetical protein
LAIGQYSIAALSTCDAEFSICELPNSNGQITTEVQKSNVPRSNYIGVRYDAVRDGSEGTCHGEGVAGESANDRPHAGGND